MVTCTTPRSHVALILVMMGIASVAGMIEGNVRCTPNGTTFVCELKRGSDSSADAWGSYVRGYSTVGPTKMCFFNEFAAHAVLRQGWDELRVNTAVHTAGSAFAAGFLEVLRHCNPNSLHPHPHPNWPPPILGCTDVRKDRGTLPKLDGQIFSADFSSKPCQAA